MEIETTTEAAPVADAPVVDAPVVDAPVVEDIEIPADLDLDAPLVDTPVVDEPPVEDVDPFADFGGREKIAEAQRVYELTQTDEGVVQLFIEAGRSLGLSFEQMETLFNAQQAAAPAAEEDDLDAPLTKREWMEQQRAAQAAAQQAAAAQSKAAVFSAAQTAVTSTITELGLTMDDEATKVVMQFGDAHFDRENPTPENVRAAVLRGHAEYTAFLDKQARTYLKEKRDKAAGVPKAPVGASAPASPSPDEPKSAAEAAARVRARLGY